MTRKAVLFRHMKGDDGGCFPALLQEHGFQVGYVDWFDNQTFDDLSDADLMVVLGGAQQVWQKDEYPWLAHEKQVIREWVEDKAKPYIGLCLGHQLLATSLDGDAALANEKEIGVLPVQFSDGQKHTVTQWHTAEVTKAPSAATVEASSDICAIQMMSIGDHAYSTQFHHEWDHHTVTNWPDGWPEQMDKSSGQDGFYNQFTKDVSTAQSELTETTHKLFKKFMKRHGW